MTTEENVRGGEVLLKLVPDMDTMTSDRTLAMGLENAQRNNDLITAGKSIRDLRTLPMSSDDRALVLAAGPSIRRDDPTDIIAANRSGATLVAADSALSLCLKSGILPDLVVSVDPHAQRIVRWFGDPSLTEESIKEDDYFRRQDLDTSFADELENNRKILDLMDELGSSVKIALASTASSDLVERVHEIGMQVFWFNPMLDDPDRAESETIKLCRRNGLPAMNAGGNVGTACWMMAHAVLECSHVGVVGMDFGYYDDTPLRNTQYFHEAVDLVGEDRIEEVFIHLKNPHTGEWFYTDPAYYWYRQSFLELAPDANCTTYNCTGGGILFGDNIVWSTLQEFYEQSK
jgi:hypothetical protein